MLVLAAFLAIAAVGLAYTAVTTAWARPGRALLLLIAAVVCIGAAVGILSRMGM